MIEPRKLREYLDAAEGILKSLVWNNNYVYYSLIPPIDTDGKQEIAPGLWGEVYAGGLLVQISIDEAERWLLEQAVFGGSR